MTYIAYIKEYDSNGKDSGDSYKEWFESEEKNVSKKEAALILGKNESDIIMLQRKG